MRKDEFKRKMDSLIKMYLDGSYNDYFTCSAMGEMFKYKILSDYKVFISDFVTCLGFLVEKSYKRQMRVNLLTAFRDEVIMTKRYLKY